VKALDAALITVSAVLMAGGVMLLETGAAVRLGYVLVILGLASSATLPVRLLLQTARRCE